MRKEEIAGLSPICPLLRIACVPKIWLNHSVIIECIYIIVQDKSHSASSKKTEDAFPLVFPHNVLVLTG